MADTTISALPAASTLTGSEVAPVDQSGATVKATVAAIRNGAVNNVSIITAIGAISGALFWTLYNVAFNVQACWSEADPQNGDTVASTEAVWTNVSNGTVWVTLNSGTTWALSSPSFQTISVTGESTFDNGSITTDGAGAFSANSLNGGALTVSGVSSLDSDNITTDGLGHLTVAGLIVQTTTSLDAGDIFTDGSGGLTAVSLTATGALTSAGVLSVSGTSSLDNGAITTDGNGSITTTGNINGLSGQLDTLFVLNVAGLMAVTDGSTPTNIVTSVGWLPVTIDGAEAWLPFYR